MCEFGQGFREEDAMPGWYLHMEVAYQTAARLRARAAPPGYPISAAEAQQIGQSALRGE